MEPAGIFTKHLWMAIQPLYEEIIHHPFVYQLQNGTLPHHCFEHYLAQDILYIRDDSEALAILSEKAALPDDKAFFKLLANDGLEIERLLHDEFLHYFKVSVAREKSPVIKEYTDFLLTHAEHSPYHTGAAALLPCFWIYGKVGNHIASRSAKNNAYQKWIDTYQGEEFEAYTQQFIQIVENMAIVLPSLEKSRMRQVFIKSTNFELDFFEESMLC
jgi:thiaminase/transcriptional activator TenA